MIQFTQNLKQLREARGLSRQELADMSGISSAAIGYYETGKREPQASTLVAIATALHVSVDDLLGYHVNEFDKAAALFHDSVGGRVVLNGDYVTLSEMPPSAWNTKMPIKMSVFVNAINDCVKDFNQKTRPQILKNMIINKLNEIYYQEAQMTILNGLETVNKENYQKLKNALNKMSDKELERMSKVVTRLAFDKPYRKTFFSKHHDNGTTPTAPDHDGTDDEQTKEKAATPKSDGKEND